MESCCVLACLAQLPLSLRLSRVCFSRALRAALLGAARGVAYPLTTCHWWLLVKGGCGVRPQVARIARKRVSWPRYGAIVPSLLNAHEQVSLLLHGAFSALTVTTKALALCLPRCMGFRLSLFSLQICLP